MYVARQEKEIEKSVRCPKCGGVHVSYASMKQTSLTCHDCGFAEVQNMVMAGGKDPTGELIKVIATGALVVIGIAGAISLANALFGDSKG
jgi:ribosomal protein S27E